MSRRRVAFRHLIPLAPVAILAVGVLTISGCPNFILPSGAQASIAVLFTADDFLAPGGEYFEKARVVPLNEIESLVVTVGSIEIEQVTSEGPNTLALSSVPFEVDLVNLIGIAEVLNLPDVPAGTYSTISLMLSNPRLSLAVTPDTVVTDVQLLDDGLLTIAASFTFGAGEVSSLVLDLGGVNLSELDGGGYLLTPDIRVAVEEDIATAKLVGVIQDLDQATNTFTLRAGPMAIEVDYANAVIFLPEDSGTPTGSVQALVDGTVVVVLGTLSSDHSFIAEVIVIRSEEPNAYEYGHDSGGHHGFSFFGMLDEYGAHYDEEGNHMEDYGDHHGSGDTHHGDNGNFHPDRGHGGMM